MRHPGTRRPTNFFVVTPEQRQVVFGLVHAPGRPPTSSGDDVLRAFDSRDGVSLGVQLLADAIARKDSEDVEYALLVCTTFGFKVDHLPLLLDLTEATWHVSHENAVWYLGKYQTPAVVRALFRATQWIPDYLDFDDSRALARKAIWELGKQPGEEARQALEQLVRSDDALIRREAKHQLER